MGAENLRDVLVRNIVQTVDRTCARVWNIQDIPKDSGAYVLLNFFPWNRTYGISILKNHCLEASQGVAWKAFFSQKQDSQWKCYFIQTILVQVSEKIPRGNYSIFFIKESFQKILRQPFRTVFCWAKEMKP